MKSEPDEGRTLQIKRQLSKAGKNKSHAGSLLQQGLSKVQLLILKTEEDIKRYEDPQYKKKILTETKVDSDLRNGGQFVSNEVVTANDRTAIHNFASQNTEYELLNLDGNTIGPAWMNDFVDHKM